MADPPVPYKLVLVNHDVYADFKSPNSVMEHLVSKAGTTIKPRPVFKISCLDKNAYYRIWTSLIKHGAQKLIFKDGEWKNKLSTRSGKANDTMVEIGIKSGADWMKKEIDVGFKLTNCATPEQRNMMFLETQYLYEIAVMVVKTNTASGDSHRYVDEGVPKVFMFDCLRFIPVTQLKDPRMVTYKKRIKKNRLFRVRTVDAIDDSNSDDDDTSSGTSSRLLAAPRSLTFPTGNESHRSAPSNFSRAEPEKKVKNQLRVENVTPVVFSSSKIKKNPNVAMIEAMLGNLSESEKRSKDAAKKTLVESAPEDTRTPRLANITAHSNNSDLTNHLNFSKVPAHHLDSSLGNVIPLHNPMVHFGIPLKHVHYRNNVPVQRPFYSPSDLPLIQDATFQFPFPMLSRWWTTLPRSFLTMLLPSAHCKNCMCSDCLEKFPPA